MKAIMAVKVDSVSGEEYREEVELNRINDFEIMNGRVVGYEQLPFMMQMGFASILADRLGRGSDMPDYEVVAERVFHFVTHYLVAECGILFAKHFLQSGAPIPTSKAVMFFMDKFKAYAS